MRQPLLIALVLLASHGVYAQQSTTAVPALPSIGLPLPGIGLPLPTLGLPPVTTPIDTPQRPPAPPHSPTPIVFFGFAPYAWGVDPSLQADRPGIILREPPPAPPIGRTARASGTLTLKVTPPQTQIFIDGEFVGAASDFGDPIEFQLEEGAHQLELRARDHQAVEVIVRIIAGRAITYSSALTRVPQPPRPEQAPPPPAAAKPNDKASEKSSGAPKPGPEIGGTFYLIPGCYIGNVPPQLVKLPDGCDTSRVITHTPSRPQQ